MEPDTSKTQISIDSGTILRIILFVLLFVGLYVLRDLVMVVLAAIVIASAIEPATRWFERHNLPRIPAVLLMYVLIGGIGAGIIYFFIPPLLSDISGLISQAPEYINSLPVGLDGGNVVTGGGALGIDVSESFSLLEIVNQLQRTIGAEGGAFSLVSKIFGGVLSFILIVTLSFYLAVQKNGISNFLRVVTPFQYEDYIINLWERSQRKIGKWLQGQLVLMLIVGLLTYLGLAIVGIKHALLLGILAGLFEIIPVFGPILAAIPAVAIGFVDGGVTVGLITIGLFLIIQQLENNLIHPLVVTKVVGVPPMLIIIALVIGGELAGFLGIVLSVPLAAALMEYVNDISHRKEELHKKRQPSDAV